MSTTGRENRKAYEPFANACVHGEPPACAMACPLNLDVREIVRHIQKGNFTAAYKAYRVKAVFPEIVAEVCDEPCKGGCVRKDLDESIELRSLEKACVEFAHRKDIPSFNLPPRAQRIAVIGGGLSGLTCAVKLASKSYPVTVYERSGRLGGRLWDLLDSGVLLPALEAQLEATGCAVRLGMEITSLADVEGDAVVAATGRDGEAFGLLEDVDPRSFGSARPGVFAIGNLLGSTPVEDVAHGRIAAFSVEKYLKVGAMDGMPETFRRTRCAFEMDLSQIEPRAAVVPGGDPYEQKEAQSEADRCLLCDCTVCSDGCELFAAVRRMPKQMVAEAMASLHSTKSGGAVRAMSSCNLCGLCGKTCPQGIDMGRFYTDFRVFKREDGLLPAAFHEFFMNDMRFANDEAYLARAAPGRQEAGRVFFPGCQLAASDPRHVELTYHLLLQNIPDMGLILGCCGAPAEWAAETTIRDAVAERMTAEWERLGRPEFVFACPSCKLQFERHVPEIPGVSLYAVLLEAGMAEPGTVRSAAIEAGGQRAAAQHEACVFDPCSSRCDEAMQQSVRLIAEKAGVSLAELPYSGQNAQCCGWGGHIDVANPKLHHTIVRNRVSAHSLPYITYCANCQEVFTRQGKASRHVLDLVLGLDKTEYRAPSLGQRRTNRMAAKRNVLAREWGDAMQTGDDMSGPDETGSRADATSVAGRVSISDELLSRMYDERILEDDVYKTIEYCEATGNAAYDPGRDLHIGHLRIGTITYWVEYRKSAEGYAVTNVYSHRMEIVERRVGGSTP